MKSLSVRTKVVGGFGIVLALMSIIAVVGYSAISSLRASSTILASQSLQQVELAKQLEAQVIAADDDGAWYMLTVKPADSVTYKARYTQDLQVIAQTETAIRALPLTDTQRAELAASDGQ